MFQDFLQISIFQAHEFRRERFQHLWIGVLFTVLKIQLEKAGSSPLGIIWSQDKPTLFPQNILPGEYDNAINCYQEVWNPGSTVSMTSESVERWILNFYVKSFSWCFWSQIVKWQFKEKSSIGDTKMSQRWLRIQTLRLSTFVRNMEVGWPCRFCLVSLFAFSEALQKKKRRNTHNFKKNFRNKQPK